MYKILSNESEGAPIGMTSAQNVTGDFRQKGVLQRILENSVTVLPDNRVKRKADRYVTNKNNPLISQIVTLNGTEYQCYCTVFRLTQLAAVIFLLRTCSILTKYNDINMWAVIEAVIWLHTYVYSTHLLVVP